MSWRSTRAAARRAGRKQEIAVIDLGSNSWRLVVYSFVPDSWWKLTDEIYETVRIGEGLAASGRLGEPAIERGLQTLEVFARFCQAAGIGRENIHPVATSAIRDADNREEFLTRARERSGLEVEVLSAEQEAYFGYVAAVNTTTLTEGAMLDLGGGSLQLVQVRDRAAVQCDSFPLGAVRLTERFLAADRPAKNKELSRVRAHVREALGGVDWLTPGVPRLVGIGGAARNLAAAAQQHGGELDLGVQGSVLSPARLGELTEQLAAMAPAERGQLPGIKPGRGDIILAAALTIATILELCACEGLEVSEGGLRDGVFLARALLAGREPLLHDVRQASVRNLAVQYESDMDHVEHVALLALEMHDSLARTGLIEPEPGERELLWAAAMLHDVGMTISYDDHHKHSRYLIASAGLPGFDPRERALIAQVSRYHRKGVPKLGEMAGLTREGDEELLSRCSVILRLAEHLERGRDQSVRSARLRSDGDDVDLHLDAGGDVTLACWSVERYGDDEMFQRVFGRKLVIG